MPTSDIEDIPAIDSTVPTPDADVDPTATDPTPEASTVPPVDPADVPPASARPYVDAMSPQRRQEMLDRGLMAPDGTILSGPSY